MPLSPATSGVRLQTPILKMQVSRDVAGVELGGALKNAYSLALGLCDGLGLGLNTKAAIITRALPEMTRLGVALGGRRATFSGLAGLGDLLGTGLSDQSRNRRAGEELALRSGDRPAVADRPGRGRGNRRGAGGAATGSSNAGCGCRCWKGSGRSSMAKPIR